LQSHPIPLRLTLVVLLFLLAAIGAQAQGGFVRARVRSFNGVARIYAQPGVFAPKINQLLEPGNKIETGQNGRVVISLNDGGSQITVLPNSNVVLKNFRDAQSVRELLEIIVGRVIVKIHHIGGKPNPYRLNSPAASIAVRGTEFIVDVLPGGETLVLVREGLVEVWSHNNPDNKRMVTPGSRVIVRPGGDISSAFPGPGSGLNGRTRFNLNLGEDYQRSVDSVAQNSNEISPVFFSAFSDQHLDSLENPAYAADFKSAEGRLFLLPSASKPYWDISNSEDEPRLDYSVSPQLTFFTPIPGSRLVVGGGVSGFGARSENRSNYWFIGNPDHDRQSLRLNAFNASLVAAYSFGDHGKTSVGIGVDKLSGRGNFLNEISYSSDRYYAGHYDNLNARFSRTRLTFGFTHRFSDAKKLGLYYRHSINSSDQDNHHLHEYEYKDGSYPSDSYYMHSKTNISNLSSEIGARFRASLTRRLFYGVEGSYLYERINNRREMPDQRIYNHNHYLARRARLGMGLGFALASKTILNFDVTGGIFNNDRPAQEPINASGNLFSFSLSPGSLKSVRGTSVSAHAAAQTNLWRGLYMSLSNLNTIRRDLFYDRFVTYRNIGASVDGKPIYEGIVSYEPFKIMDTGHLSSLGMGWKFKPNVTAEYVYSVDHRYRESSHSVKIRYTFNLGITGEK
jgi:FecR protein